MDILQYETDGAIGYLTLNRPERLNALNHEMVRALRAFWDERHRDYGTRVIIVTGAGRGFCAGLDLKAEGEQDQWQPGVGPVQDIYTFQEDIADLVTKMRRCPQPIISAVNGAATGGGLSIALASDVRIATEHARFACSFLNIGLSGCDVGSSYHLPKVVGADHAADLIHSGRLVDGREALDMGLVTKLVEPEELLAEATRKAEEWCQRSSPMGLRLSKEVLNETVTGISLENALKLENRNQILAGQTADADEAKQAWAEKRDPVWRDA
ncbi:MAG: enoyl-CoA hydratase/isomerase family protein [Dehalococcoidia bacterium]|nr:enoyl-CoA hydratase/isomerase family protein [Dehalococcoidia bacterium]